jgi:drug/metabolite transporter (DMT)-like permease
MWIILSILAQLIFALVNHIDKFIVSRLGDIKVGALIIVSSIVAFIPVTFSGAILQESVFINAQDAFIIFIGGLIFISSLWFYFDTLKVANASTVAPLIQMTPVFALIFGILFLDENITSLQLLASGVIIASAIGLSFNFEKTEAKFNKKVFFNIFLYAFSYALLNFLFKLPDQNYSLGIRIFWQYLGISSLSILLLIFNKNYRLQFIRLLSSKKKVLFLNIFNESITLIAFIMINIAVLIGSLGLVYVFSAMQPVFTFLLGILLSVFIKQYNHENENLKTKILKFFLILLIVSGSIIITITN